MKKCSKCGGEYDHGNRFGYGGKSLVKLTDSWSGRDVWCCPICKDDRYLVDKEA